MKSSFSGFIRLLSEAAGRRRPEILFMAATAGLLQAMIVIIVMDGALQKLPEGGLNLRYFLLFVLCTAGYVLAHKHYLTRSISVVNRFMFSSHVRIVDKLRSTALLSYEQLEEGTIHQYLLNGGDIVIEASRYLVNAICSASFLFFALIYVGSLSIRGLLLAVLFYVAALSIYLTTQKAIQRNLKTSRNEELVFFKHCGELMRGFKELKINQARSDDLFENDIEAASARAEQLKRRAENQVNNNDVLTHTFRWLLIAVIIFLLPRISSLDPEVIIVIFVSVMFTLTPLGEIARTIPLASKAEVVIRGMDDLEQVLDANLDVSATKQVSTEEATSRTISLQDVFFRYSPNGDNPVFRLGPLDLDIRQGEVLFLTSANGTGKTTLLKIISGLYHPSEGQIRFDDRILDGTNIQQYRNQFSCIFEDFHLFDRLYGMKDLDEEILGEWLERFELDGVTRYQGGRFTNLDLSAGQRKRLALIISLLEKKPFAVFDEVTADLDPEFRKYFYEEFLQALREEGKTIVAVSHDDRYFQFADRVIRMEDGSIVADRSPDKPPGQAPATS